MKRITKLMLVLSVCWLMTACGAKSPSGIAKIVLKAEQTLDYEPVKKHLTEKRRSFVEQFQKLCEEDAELKRIALSQAKEKSYKVISEEIAEDGNSATVTIRETWDSNTFNQRMNFVKESGEWKVDEYYTIPSK